MNKLGVAVIGTGFWGKNHARVYKELENTNLVAICDVDPERAKIIAEQYGVKAYTNSSDMLKDREIQAVSVCTWSTKLAEEALKCLNTGKHVLVEKPMATNTKQAQTLIDTAKANDLHLSVGFLMRFIPGIQQIKQAIETKKIGELVSATAKRVTQWPERIGDVGVVKDTAIHDIDVMHFISGEKPVSVYAKMGNMRHRQFEDYAQIMLTYEGGKTAFIEANWLTPYKIRSLNVTGSEAIMRLDYNSQELWIENATETVQPRSPFKEPLKAELVHFIECIIEKKTPVITGEDGYNALEIATAAMESSVKNTVMKLNK
ncbi:MAG: Gfo/Idh/MocA family oxidoreductase [Candidatus Bathyarchaeota archaeon]|nr:Gfo/Idh/MocA family oxidoreductase [Candidatus Termiticorpusculum sp.]MCL2867926.1 Gfo/Idh/MocA family oxidoreductase [Candidatus Termiticorpusculum sp.]